MPSKFPGLAALLLLSLPLPTALAAQDGDAPRVQALYTTWDDYYFYAGFQVNDAEVIATNSSPTSQPQMDDDIELFFETDGARAGVRTPKTFQMAVSAANGAYFSVGDGTRIPKAKAVYSYKYAATVQGALNDSSARNLGYTVEVAIPWQELGLSGPPQPGTVWGFNAISRDRNSLAEPAGRLYSLSPLVTGGADVQTPSKWSRIEFQTDAPARQTREKIVSPHTVQGRFPLINGAVVSGEWPALAKISFGTEAVTAPAPTAAEEPNTSTSPFASPPPVAPTPASPPPPTVKPKPGPDKIDLGNGLSVGIVPGGSAKPEAVKPTAPVTPKPFVNPLQLNVPAKLRPVSGGGFGLPLNPPKPPTVVMAVYRLGENGDPRKGAAQTVWAADGASTLAAQPINGTGPWFSGLRPLWHKQQLTDLRRAGIEVALLQADGKDAQTGRQLDALVEALKEMKAARQDYPLIAGDASLSDLLARHVPAEFRAPSAMTDSGEATSVTLGGARTPEQYQRLWQPAVEAKTKNVVIQTWNDFAHHSEIAASRQYGERYADLTRIQTIAFNGNRQWHAKYLTVSAPHTILPKQLYQAQIRIENAGTLPWRAGEGYSLCPRWYKDGRLYDDSAPRVPVGTDVLPGQAVTLGVGIVARNGYGDDLEPGHYTLVVDMVQNENRWFSFAGDEPLQIPITVAASEAEVKPTAAFLGAKTPVFGQAGQSYPTLVHVRNDGGRAWANGAYSLAYKIQTVAEDGSVATVADGETAAFGTSPTLPGSVLPGDVAHIPAVVALAGADRKPLALGEYRLHWYLKPHGDAPALPESYDEGLQITATDPGASFVLASVPRQVDAGQEMTALLAVQNLGPQPWPKTKTQIGYHWHYLDGTEAQWDGGTLTPLPADLAPGRINGDIAAKVRAPKQPGRYALIFDVKMPDGSWASTSLAAKGTDLLQTFISVTGKGDAVPVDLAGAYNAPASEWKGVSLESLPPDQTTEVDANPILIGAVSPLYPSGYYAAQRGAGWESNHAVPFQFAPAGQEKSILECRGQTVDLPDGSYRSLHLLMAATGGQTVTAAFDLDGQSHSVPVADWSAAPPEGTTVGLRLPSADGPGERRFGDYTLPLDGKRIGKITLPNTPDVKILAITLVK